MEIKWGDQESNVKSLEECLDRHQGEADLLVLPEMFSTGFCVDKLSLTENKNHSLIKKIERLSEKYEIAICGSLMYEEEFESEGNSHRMVYFNRGFFISPQGDTHFYDKRHTFKMGNEGKYFHSGNQRTIVEFGGFRFLLQICYDLRFPVFSRCRANDYDVILYVACWPMSRINAWRILLPARAIENLSYVVGVNACGVDDMMRKQGGHSMVVDMKGNTLVELEEKEEWKVVEFSKEELEKFRLKFPVWKDADDFVLCKS